MNRVRSFEQDEFADLNSILLASAARAGVDQSELRRRVLEFVAADIGGYDYEWYTRELGVGKIPSECRPLARQLATALRENQWPPALALASLAGNPPEGVRRRFEGVFHTDPRLATALVKGIFPRNGAQRILDPACGSGILLVAAALELTRSRKCDVDTVLSECIYGADLSRDSLRGAALALAALGLTRRSARGLFAHLRQGDSLRQGKSLWTDSVPDGFDVVVANPPWEKLKLSTHEFLVGQGSERHYGADLPRHNAGVVTAARSSLKSYVRTIEEGFSLQGGGEPDAFKLFLELGLQTIHSKGTLAYLVPGGLIRSQGCESLRRHLLEKASHVELQVFDNKSRFFPIDTRFKFLMLRAQFDKTASRDLVLTRSTATRKEVVSSGRVTLQVADLASIRPDLTVPELFSAADWELFFRLSQAHPAFGASDGGWHPSFMREVDMTRDRPRFVRVEKPGHMPLVEGRMVHQFRHDMKEYVSGTGRAARWKVRRGDECRIRPQFWFPPSALTDGARRRASLDRVGFCDITGQTNERTVLAALIPPGVVCGNKVPTIEFDDARKYSAWLGIANSLTFDWIMRRLVTTTLNYFIIEGAPFPQWNANSRSLSRIAELSRALSHCNHFPQESETRPRASGADVRPALEIEVADLFGVDYLDLKRILEDFPLLDRGQPPLPGEKASTITRDTVLALAARRLSGGQDDGHKRRKDRATKLGAVPFAPWQDNIEGGP